MKAYDQRTDEELVEIAQRNPGGPEARRAAAVLFERYSGRVYIWALRYTQDHDRALDLSQDVFLNAWRQLAAFQGRSRFFAWLFAITRNRCLNALRRPSLVRDEDVEVDRLTAPQSLPDRAYEEKLDEQVIHRLARERLDPQEHDAIYLRCFERMPIDQITVLLGIPGASGARTVLQRARRKLREAIDEYRQANDGSGGYG